MIKSYDLNTKNKFRHKFIITRLDPKSSQEMISWLKEICGKYNQDYIYWALLPSTIRASFANPPEIYIKDEQDAFAFKMRWS